MGRIPWKDAENPTEPQDISNEPYDISCCEETEITPEQIKKRAKRNEKWEGWRIGGGGCAHRTDYIWPEKFLLLVYIFIYS